MILNVNPQLNQWDVNRFVEVSDTDATHIHFANPGDSKAPIIEIVDDAAQIPNYLLQTGKPVVAYAVLDGVTIWSKTFPVRKRERPENYVYEDDQRNYIYELIANAEAATQGANEAAAWANEAADRASEYAGDVEALQNELTDLRTDYEGNEYESASEAVRGATMDLNVRLQNLDGTVDENTSAINQLRESLDNLDNPGGGGSVATDQIPASEFVVGEILPDAEEDVKLDDILIELFFVSNSVGAVLDEHINNANNPNPHEITCEKIGAVAEVELADKVAEIITEDCTEFGPIAEAIDTNTAYTATWVSEMMMSQHDILLYDEDINEYVRNVPTKYEFQSAVGDIEAALDGILAMQTELIGGDGV